MQQQDHPSPLAGDDLAFAREFIAACRWQYAASVPEHPHEYSLRRWLSRERQPDFDRFAAMIDAHGEPGWFWRQRWVYLAVDERKYWQSNELFGDGGLILNRARIDEPDEHPQLGLEGMR